MEALSLRNLRSALCALCSHRSPRALCVQAVGLREAVIRRGGVLGEFSYWCPGRQRMTTVRGQEPGLLATMLVDELQRMQVP